MKKLLLIFALCGASLFCQAQQKFLSYDDLVYLVTNNLQKANEFMLSKGYESKNKKAISNKGSGSVKYTLAIPGGNSSEVEIRADGRRMYVYIATDEIQQVNLINNSVAPFLLSKNEDSGILNYKVKELGNIYFTSIEKTPPSPIKKDYDIRIVSDRNITSYN
jgi:hypothetical protein